MHSNVICMKWGTKYDASYVNKLYAMVNRHLSLPFQMICFTDDINGIRSEVETRTLPSLQLPPDIPERGWMKLATFEPNLGGLTGPTLFLDLDVVIVNNIDTFFTHGTSSPETVYLAHDQKKRKANIGNSSVYRFTIGQHTDILEYFRDNFVEINQQHRNEQAYLSTQLAQKNALGFWPTHWCPSFKYHCIPSFPKNLWTPPTIPDDAKIILFHGLPEPDAAARGVSGKWYRYFQPCDWITKHWVE